MGIATALLALAITVEGIVEYSKSIYDAIANRQVKAMVIQLVAAATGVMIAVMARIDIFSFLGVDFTCPVFGYVITGLCCSRGSNYVSDIIGALAKMKSSEKDNEK